MLKKLLFTLFVVLIHTVVLSATKTYVGPNSGDWNTADNWSPIGTPTSTDAVIIPSGKTVAISSDSFAQSISLSGSLSINSGIRLTVGSVASDGNFTVNSEGRFSMGSGNDLATLIVYGNYINNGSTDFWKSDVVIAGDLLSPTTSTLQKQGNVVVGGNIIGNFNITGNEVGVIYAVNPNATVAITPSGLNQNITPGTPVPITSANSALLALVNSVIYGSDCPFSVSGTTNNSACARGTTIFTAIVTPSGSSPAFQWEVNMGSGWSDLFNNTVYSEVTTGNLKVSNITAAMNNYKFRVRITVSACAERGNYGFLTVNPVPTITTQPIDQLDCERRDVNFKVVAIENGLTYSWQYKKLGESGFTPISSTTSNVSNFSTNIITIRNVGSTQFPNETQFQVVVSNGTCSVTSDSARLMVNEITAVIPNATNVSQCYGSSYTYTVSTSYPANVVSYQWKKSIASGAWTVVNNAGAYSGATTASLKITGGAPSESAEYRVYITFTNSTTQCSVDSSSRTRLITFLPSLTTPQTTLTNPDCTISNRTIAVTVQSATDSYSFDNGATYQASNIKSALTPQTYKIIIKNIGGCLSPVTDCIITASSESIWNGSVWSPSEPTSIDKITFMGNYSGNQNLTACSCEVKSGIVIIQSGKTMTLTNGLTVSGGSLTFENSASLVQINNTATNTGNIIYKRITPAIMDTDYVYWSSPVIGYTLGAVSPNTLAGKMYSYDAFASPEDWKQEYSGTVMAPGKGYIVRGPEFVPLLPVAPAPFPASFIGVPNNGTITIPIGGTGTSNLIGNPYPSALDADSFLTANSAVLEGTIYFWTHNTAIQLAANIINGSAGSGAYAYTSDDYASYNFTGGVGVAGTGTAAITVGFNGSITPSGKIGSGQSFFTTSIASGKMATFDNNMRLDKLGVKLDNTQFFKNASNTKAVEVVQKNRVWLNLTNAHGAFKQTLVGYVSGATNDFDGGYDGESFDGNEFVDFYSINNDKNLVIQGRALPFEESDTIPLGYRSAIAGDFTISIDQVDGSFTGKGIYLKDNMTNSIHNLDESAYDFTTELGTFKDRFELRYTNKTLETNNFETSKNTVLISNKNKEVKISSAVELINKVQVWNLEGKLIYQKSNLNTTEFVISNIVSNNQVVLVKVGLRNGHAVTQKIVY
jgi:hypothetical protein